MRMSFLASVLVGFPVAVLAVQRAADSSILEELNKAKEAYEAATEKAKEKVLVASDEQRKKLEANTRLKIDEKLKAMERFDAERRLFESDPAQPPKSDEMKVVVSAYRTAVSLARQKCAAAFDKAAAAYGRNKDLDGARAVLAEKAVFFPEESPFPTLPMGAKNIDRDAEKRFLTTKSGLKYRILRKGSGRFANASNNVTVNYHGWLDDGKVFDSSYERRKPSSFPVNRVIKGWGEGMQLVGEGGMIELDIPPDLGYAAKGSGNAIPPNARLHFLVEVLKIE